MTAHDDATRAKRFKRTRRVVQVATCASVVTLSCSVYDPSLLAGSDPLRDGGSASQRATAGDSGYAPAHGGASSVRVTVTAGAPFTDSAGKVNPTWASFWELRVYGY